VRTSPSRKTLRGLLMECVLIPLASALRLFHLRAQDLALARAIKKIVPRVGTRARAELRRLLLAC